MNMARSNMFGRAVLKKSLAWITLPINTPPLKNGQGGLALQNYGSLEVYYSVQILMLLIHTMGEHPKFFSHATARLERNLGYSTDFFKRN